MQETHSLSLKHPFILQLIDDRASGRKLI